MVRGPGKEPLRFKARAAAYAVYEMRRSGAGIEQIARHFGYSKQRASQLALDGIEIAHGIASGDLSWELSPRSRNSLVSWGEGIMPGAVAKIQLDRVPGLGAKSQQEILDWLARHAPAV